MNGDTSTAPHARSRPDCAGLGPDLLYALDLRAFSEPVSLYAELRGSFVGSLAIESGPLDDPFLVACNTGHAPGAPEAFLAVTLEPQLYRVVVDGQGALDQGAFELVLELAAPGQECTAPPPNDRCDQATPIDPALPLQTFFGTTECATDQAQATAECSDFAFREGEVFYSLDLSQRTQPTLVHASTRLPPTDHDTILFVVRDAQGICAEPLLCNYDYEALGTELWANLEPGHYLLAVEGEGDEGDFGLSVEIAPEPCSVSNDTCETAQVIEPVLGQYTFTAWPGCGNGSIVNGCNLYGSPDIFYRLDLRAFSAPVRVRASTRQAGREYTGLALLAQRAGSCGNELRCGDFDLWLAPDRYYLALSGTHLQQGPVELSVELSDQERPAPAECIDERVAACARVDRETCCAGADADCWLSYLNCGLKRSALDCLCQADPGCCGADPRSYECGPLLAQCGTFCDGFDPALVCPQ